MIDSITLSINNPGVEAKPGMEGAAQQEWSFTEQLSFLRQIMNVMESMRGENDNYRLEIIMHAHLQKKEQPSIPATNPELQQLTDLLSKREVEVLNLVFGGYTNKEIAHRLFISVETVKSHRKHILEKTGSRNTAAIIKCLNFPLTGK